MVTNGDPRRSHLIRPPEAIAVLGGNTVFLEVVPWRHAGGTGLVEGSISGAFEALVAEDFAGSGGGTGGHLPLPEASILQQRLEAWGVSETTPVIIYTRQAGAFNSAARAWFVLRWAGIEDVRVLDGQLDGWAAAGGPLSSEPARAIDRTAVRSGSSSLATGQLPTLDARHAYEIAQDGTLIDARPVSAYAGDPSKERSGHIPGAISGPSSEISRAGTLLPSAELRKWFLRHHAIGPRAGAYCGGGVASAGLVFAAASIGEVLPLYVASWSGWSADPEAPVEQGTGISQVGADDSC
jgi:thiosulfate/3-mercaptopyruvate sulfurtransferase